MGELKKSLVNANEAFLISISNKGIYKRACKDIEGVSLISHQENDVTVVELNGESVTVKPNLIESKCSCVSRTMCRHIIGAIMLLRNNLSEDDVAEVVLDTEEEKEEIVAPVQVQEEKSENNGLKQKDIEKINACAKDFLEVLGNILRDGLVRISETAPETLEICAVRSHSLKMADCERLFRELSMKLTDCLERRASFSRELFTDKFCECIGMLERLTESDITREELGVFRQDYKEYNGNLTILPIGQRKLKGGDYEGEIYYFLNMDESAEHRFMSLSNLYPSFYETTRNVIPKISPWGMISPLSSMMKKKMILGKAKVSGGKLSTSSETNLLMHSKADLNCQEVRNLICTDFREILVKLSENNIENELDRMFFVAPKKCISSQFDKYSQNYIMVIEDLNGNRIKVRAKYREESSGFIQLLESIGKKMLENPEKSYTLLATAYIDEMGLNLFPIEIYDFITSDYYEYDLPEDYQKLENADFVTQILDLTGEIKDYMEITLQCGLQSDIKHEYRLENTAFNYGLKGLSIMTASFMESVSVYRHNTNNNVEGILHELAELYRYIKIAEKKLEVISAMYKLNNYD